MEVEELFAEGVVAIVEIVEVVVEAAIVETVEAAVEAAIVETVEVAVEAAIVEIAAEEVVEVVEAEEQLAV